MITILLIEAGCQTQHWSVARYRGVEPILPPVSTEITTTDSSRPTFEWLTTGSDRHTYDLVIAGPLDWADGRRIDFGLFLPDGSSKGGKVAYYRQGLRHTKHRIEQKLAPGALYAWSVRTRYTVTGEVSGWATFDGRRTLTGGERRENLHNGAKTVALQFTLALLTVPIMGYGATLVEVPRFHSGEAIELEYHPFLFRTPVGAR